MPDELLEQYRGLEATADPKQNTDPLLSSYRDQEEQERKDRELKAKVATTAKTVKPDERAANNALAQETGIPLSVVERNKEDVVAQSVGQKAVDATIDAPVTRALLDDPDAAAVAYDDAERLSTIEKIWKYGKDALKRGGLRIQQAGEQFGAEWAGQIAFDQKSSFGEILEDEQSKPSVLKNADEYGVLSTVADYSSAEWRWITSRVQSLGDMANRALGYNGTMSEEAQKGFLKVGEIRNKIANLPLDQGSLALIQAGKEAAQKEGLLGALKVYATDPLQTFALGAQIAVEQTPVIAAAGATTAATRSPAAGAGVMGAGSFITERYTGAADFLEKKGVKLDSPEAVVKLLQDKKLIDAAASYGFSRGAIIGTIDTITGGLASKTFGGILKNAVTQIGIQAAGGGGGEALAQAVTEGNVDWNEVALEMVSEIVGTPGDIAAVGGSFLSDKRRSAQAAANAEKMDKVREQVESSPLTQRDPERMVQHQVDSLKASGIKKVWLDSEAFLHTLPNDTTTEQLAQQWGLDPKEVTAAIGIGGDIELTPEQFARHVMLSDDYAKIQPYVRWQQDGMTANDAKEFDGEGVEEAINDLVSRDTKENPTEADKETEAVSIAAGEFGLQGLFTTAKEAGMSDKEFSEYLVNRAEAAEAGRTRQEKKMLTQAIRVNEAKWKAEEENVRQAVEQSLRQQPIYQILESMGVNRFNYDSVDISLAEPMEFDPATGENKVRTKAEQIAALPKRNGQSIVAPRGHPSGTIDAEAMAELFGYDHPREMMLDLQTAPDIKEAIAKQTNEQMLARHGDLNDQRQALVAAMESLHNDTQEALLAQEMNALNDAKENGRIKPALLRQAARNRMAGEKVSSVNADHHLNIERREGRRAGKLLRKGDRLGAARAKFRQLSHFMSARLAYKMQTDIIKQKKYLNGFLKSSAEGGKLPLKYLDTIKAIIGDFDLGPKLTDRQRGMLHAKAFAQAVEDGDLEFDIPARIQAHEAAVARGVRNYQDLTVQEWNDLVDLVKTVEWAGLQQNKLLRADEKATRQQAADEVAGQIAANLKLQVGKYDPQHILEVIKRAGRAASTIVLNGDSLVRAIDGLKDLGRAWHWLKRPYNNAIHNGYHAGQIGFQRRMAKEADAVLRIKKAFTKKERANMLKSISVPGVRSNVPMSHNRVLAVLYNSGNEYNLQAMVESEQFSMEEIKAIWNYASKKDWDHAQAVWDYLATFRPEIIEATERRENRRPEMVEAVPIETPHGTYRGGYYPLRYSTQESVVESITKAAEKGGSIEAMRKGAFVSSHTKRGHTEERSGSGGRKVLLDTGVFDAHVKNVVYDLEVGDALTDIFRILNHKTVRKAFEDQGQVAWHQALELWLGDVMLGEYHADNLVENSARWLRGNITIAKLAYNWSVGALQFLGLAQTGVQIGQRNMLRGLYAITTGTKLRGEGIITEINRMSPMMTERQQTFDANMHEAARAFREGWLTKRLPDRVNTVLRLSMFYHIYKMQRFVDLVTWAGAKASGLEKFNGDEAKANEFADLMVERAQGSAIIGNRTPFERGTIHNRIRQTELVRLFTPLQSYFMAKLNVAWERTGKTKFTNPLSVASWLADMMILYTFEGIAAQMIRQGASAIFDDDDDDDKALKVAGKETLSAIGAGLPIISGLVSAAQGYRGGGGVFDIAKQTIGNFAEQSAQLEFDKAFVKSAIDMAGVFMRLPGATQINKTIEAAHRDDSDLRDYIMGPAFDK